MISKDFFVLKDADLIDFKEELSNYKNNILNLIEKKEVLSMSCFYELEKTWTNKLEQIMSKYALHYYANIDEKIINVYQEMIKEYRKLNMSLFQSVNFYEFVKNLVVEDFCDETLKNKMLKSFEDSGLNLSPEKQEQLKLLKDELTTLSLNFNKNISNHKQNSKIILDDNLKQNLSEKELKWFNNNELKYDDNIFVDILEESTSSELRSRVYELRNKIASYDTEYDNSNNIKSIVQKRQEIATLLGKKDYTEVVIQDRMAKNANEVIALLNNLLEVTKPMMNKESDEFLSFVKNKYGIESLQHSDKAYYSNLYSEQKFAYEKDSEREYFPFKYVLESAFELIERLYGITFEKYNDIDLPYENTESFKVYNNGIYKGIMITDFFYRDKKNDGAWVSAIQSPSILEEGIVTINTNFDKNKKGLILDDIITLFHEFGHLVHAFSTAVKYTSLSGTSGMAKDAVEIPSQMLEKFASESSILKDISKKTGIEIPDELLEKILLINKDSIGSFYSRQISFSLFDILIHKNPSANAKDLFKEITLDVFKGRNVDTETGFENRFSHIFSSGYSVGYYSYIWSDVYSVDAFMFIKENEDERKHLFKDFLSFGSSMNPDMLYYMFRGSKANLNNFLMYYGLSN